MLYRLYEAREKAELMGGSDDADRVAKEMGADAQQALSLGRDFENKMHTAMDDDFNTAQSLGYAFELARAINRFGNHKKARKRGAPIVAPALEAFALLAKSTGLLQMETEAFHAEVKAKRLSTMGITSDEVDKLIEERSTARADKAWDRADQIREQLDQHHILVRDMPGGVEWRVRIQAPAD